MTHERPTANPMLASLLDDSLSNGTNDHVDRVHVKVQGSTSPRSPCPAKRRKRGIEADAHHTSPLSSAAFLLTAHQRPPPSVLSIKSVSRKQEPASNSSYNNTSSSNTSLDYSPNQVSYHFLMFDFNCFIIYTNVIYIYDKYLLFHINIYK